MTDLEGDEQMGNGTKMIRSLMSYYGTPDVPTQDERLASAAKVLAERVAAQDRIDLKEHDRRYHGGQYESGEPCPFREKIAKMEESMGTLDPKDADGDGTADFAEEERKEEAEAEVQEDSAVGLSDAEVNRRLRRIVARRNPDLDDSAIDEYLASLEK
jgi:hypothetical protein